MRNGGKVFTFPRMLGCATLDMLRKYLALVDVDSAEAHRKAKPVERRRLTKGIKIDWAIARLSCLSNMYVNDKLHFGKYLSIMKKEVRA